MSAAERIELARAAALAGVDSLPSESANLTGDVGEVTTNADVVQAAACAATFWRNHSDEVKALLDSDLQAAALA